VRLVGAVLACILLACGATRAQTADLKFQAVLVWGTNDGKSPDPKHKPVEPEIRKKLKGLPLKWTNYFEVDRKTMTIPAKGSQKVELGRCELEVKDLGSPNLEIAQYGKGKPVVRQIQTLPKGEILVLGGNAPNDTAWLVILKRLE
jgi:hypothetical protein